MSDFDTDSSASMPNGPSTGLLNLTAGMDKCLGTADTGIKTAVGLPTVFALDLIIYGRYGKH